MLLATGLMVGAFFLSSFTLQHAHHATALRTGLIFLPAAAATAVGAHLDWSPSRVLSARTIAPAGFALATLGLAAPALSTPHSCCPSVSPRRHRIGALFVTAFTASLGDAELREAGLRSAVVNTFHELGGAAGVAVVVAVLGALVAVLLTPSVRRRPGAIGIHH